MRTSTRSGGFTLIEVTVAMAILLLGALGLAGLTNMGNRMNSDGRRVTRATAIAQDLLANIALWEYADARLANGNTGNDADLGDGALAFESGGTPPADHAEADLGAGWLGIPAADLAAGGYQRFWNVSSADDWNGNGRPDAIRIAVIVRWPIGTGFRRIVLYTTKINPEEMQ